MNRVLKWVSVTAAAVFLLSGSAAASEDGAKAYIKISEAAEASLVSEDAEFTCSPSDFLLSSGTSHARLLKAEESKGYGRPVYSVDSDGVLEFDIIVERAGGYRISLDYFIPEESMQNLQIRFLINGELQFKEAESIKLAAAWRDVSQDYKTDRFGNEIYPKSERVFRWQSKYLNSQVYNFISAPVFSLKQGVNRVTVETNSVGAYFGDITFSGKKYIPDYSEYKSKIRGEVPETAPVIIEGEKFSEKSESFIRGDKNIDYNHHPYSPSQNLINMLSGIWYTPGDSVTYSLDIPKSGLYTLSFDYAVEYEKPQFINIYIDDEILFTELAGYKFEETGNSDAIETVSANGEAVQLYFEKGPHTLTLEGTSGPVYEIYEELRELINTINNTALEIKKVTGNKADKNRDWKIDDYLPGLDNDLLKMAETVERNFKKLSELYGKKSDSSYSELKVVSASLRKYAAKPEKLLNNLKGFAQTDSSAAGKISYVIQNMLYQSINVDRIIISSNNKNIPKANRNFFAGVFEEIKKMVISFFKEYDIAQSSDSSSLNVWVVRSMSHIEVLRETVMSNYEASANMQINISAMPDEQKLLLAVSSGKGPDVVLGATPFRPFDFALRGALHDFRKFDDFPEFMQDYHPEMFIPFVIGDACYAVPESVNSQMLFYRKDILDNLGLEVPQTWDDVKLMLPVLDRYGMTFNTMISNVAALKHFGATYPFIKQFGGKIYSDDGTKAAFDDPKTIEAFELMTDLYTRYSLPLSIPSFYSNFRAGITPIGMADMVTYSLLSYAAPEIAGQWGIAPAIGIRDENGVLHNDQIALATACIILENSSKKQEAWDFIKWWMDAEVQNSYTGEMRMRYGPEYLWGSSNLKALSINSTLTEENRKIIMTQIQSTTEIPRNPAYFALEREFSNAWNNVVINGMAPRTALDKAITTANRTIEQKLIEFKYISEDGKLLKPFKAADAELIKSWMEGDQK